MSRLIVKNLPKNIKEGRMNEIFSEMGQITDLQLKYTKRGIFRRFAFVGYKTQTEAQRALKHFNNTFVDTSKIQVDICKDFGDDTAPRPWSKYSEKSSAFQKRAERLEKNKRKQDGNEDEGKLEDDVKVEAKKKKKKKKKNAMLDELEDDSGFQEFLEVHKSRINKPAWTNDEQLSTEQINTGKEVKNKKEKVPFADLNDGSSDDDTDIDVQAENQSEMDVDEYQTGSKEASNQMLSDMDYLKKKVTTTEELDKNEKVTNEAAGKNRKRKESGAKQVDENENSNSENSGEKKVDSNDNARVENFERKSEFTIKLRGLPFHAKNKDIEEFLSPLKIIDIRMTKDQMNRPSGRAYVDLESKEGLKEALSRHKDYIKGRYIEVFEDKKIEIEKTRQVDEDPPWMKNAIELAENKDLSIAETGRLYLRNLSYSCTEEELSELFCKYGPTTEVFVPVDKYTNQSMGFAFVTFMMPEHAVQAFNELDGHVFQGRLLHILPAKPKKNADTGEFIEEENESSYKKKQKAKVTSLKSKDHSWNTLFLGVNAVAEIMADKYNSSKSDVLDIQSKGGLALRLALGETQVVAETKDFLTNHGVRLDSFGQPEAKRSKTVIIVKNLQHCTKEEEIEKLFSRFGDLCRVVLPPSGVTALVEFLKLSSASKAFEKIAYTKLKNVPLYLEWAPADVFDSSSNKSMKENEDGLKDQKETNEDINNQNSSESDSEPDGHVVFVKNLNFDTDEDTLKQLFSDVGKVANATIAKKKDLKKRGSFLSMGYGFVEFKNRNEALNAVKQLQNIELDGHNLQLKMSNKNQAPETVERKPSSGAKQKSSKILVRNVPFEATQKELRELFGTFGQLKTVRLPKKLSGTGPHRGFAFIDFLTKQDAKRAFKSLCTSTHLYGRRLVLEWAEDNESVEELRKKTADYFHEPKKKTKDFEVFNNE